MKTANPVLLPCVLVLACFGAACTKSHDVAALFADAVGNDSRATHAVTGSNKVTGGAGAMRLGAAGAAGAAAVSGSTMGRAAAGASAMTATAANARSAAASRGQAGAAAPVGPTGAINAGAGARNAAAASADGYPVLDLTALAAPTQIQSAVRFTLAEAPLWDPCNHRLLFVDVNASTIYTLSQDDQVDVFATNTQNTNGIAFDLDGSLILAQMARPGHLGRLDKSGAITAIDPLGSMLHTPDDVIVRSDGTIYFTDGEFPPVGGLNFSPLPVYGLAPGATQLQNGGSVVGPNGIELSPDEKTLYVDADFEGSVVQFDVAPDGTLTKGKTLATGLTGPDSLCLDAAGNLYVGVSTGLQVLRPDGTRVGVIPVRSLQGVTNCTFGGDDGTTLYITAWTGLWKLPGMPIPGLDWKVNRKRLGCASP